MKLNTIRLNVFVLSFFVINVLAIPGLTEEAMAAGSEAGAAQAGAEAGAATAAGITTGTIAAGAAIAAAAALAIATSGGEGRVAPVFPLPPEPLLPTNPAVAAAAAELLQTSETNDLALLATAVTALGTTGSTALAQAANTLGITEFQDLATLTATLDQSTISSLAAASTPEVLGSPQGGITPMDAFSTSLTNTDVAAVMTALNADIGTVPLAARDGLTPGQQKMYDYLAALRSQAQKTPALKAGFNGLYNVTNQAKNSSTATQALTSLINGLGSSDTTNKLNKIYALLTLMTSSATTFNATHDLFKTADPAEIAAIKKAFGLTVKPDGTIDTHNLTALSDFFKDAGTGTPEEITEKVRQALLALLTSQHPGFTVTVTTVHHGNNIYSTVAHIIRK